MKIDKEKQEVILTAINDLLKQKKASGTAYLFGGNSLISLDLIPRTTKDIDFFLIAVNMSTEIIDYVKTETKKQFGIKLDIGINGRFDIAAKGFTWILPKKAYARAKHILKLSNLDIFALNPLDIIALKCDRLSKRDQTDIEKVFKILRPIRDEVITVFEEYNNALLGNPVSISNIRENFYQLVLTIYDIAMEKKDRI